MKCSSVVGMMGLLALCACSSPAQHASFSNSGIIAVSDSCSALGFAPGSSQYSECVENERIRSDIIARKAFNGNKNQPDGVMAQTYGKRLGLSINCTSYATHTGGPSLCD